MAAPSEQELIRRHVRAHDPDRYIATLFAPAQARPALMALYAFNIDVARIPEAVSEPLLGEIRLQWWRDALAALEEGDSTGNPVADALGRAMREYRLPKALLHGAIDARAFDLSGEPMPDMPAFKTYLQKTQANLFAAAARIAGGPEPGSELDTLSRFAGFAWGATWLLRMLPLHLSRGRLYLPASHFRDHGAEPEELFDGVASDKAQAALLGLRDEAREAFSYARASVHVGSRKAALAFLPCALVPHYLAALEKQAAAPLAGIADINPLRRLSSLACAALWGRLE